MAEEENWSGFYQSGGHGPQFHGLPQYRYQQFGKVIGQLTHRISINKRIQPEQCAVLWLVHGGSPV